MGGIMSDSGQTMTLLEALQILREPVREGDEVFRLFVGCGFTPLDFKTFLAAYLRRRLGYRAIEIGIGLYGDLVGSLECLNAGDWYAVIVVIEWADLDPRLGLRSLGGWRADSLEDIVKTVRLNLQRLESAILRVAEATPVCCSMPSLPVPPVSYRRPQQGGPFDWALRQAVVECAVQLSLQPQIRLLSPEKLDRVAPLNGRQDVRADLAAGFPYATEYASTLANLLAGLVAPTLPKKGLITDLDDTLWSGILGEVGPGGVTWDLEHRAQVHGLYQQLLASLADAGTLVAVASKNDLRLVEEVLSSRRLLLDQKCLFPLQVNWGPKSESVAKILQDWNIAGNSVVFVDDSPMELAEVQRIHHEIECILFPKDDPVAVLELLWVLRERFSKERISEEDRIRSNSLRAVATRSDEAILNPDDFLRSLEAVITIDSTCPPQHGRALELINKTNQFNLNGRRYTEAEWANRCRQPEIFVLVAGYRDKFGPLGRVGVLSGKKTGDIAEIDCWVLSCRAFSRRIEHHVLKYVFDILGVKKVVLDFQKTDRNWPFQEFLESLRPTEIGYFLQIAAEEFERVSPLLCHSLEEVVDE